MVEFYLNRLREFPQYHDKVEFEIVPTCFSFNFEDWEVRFLKGGFSKSDIAELREGLLDITIRGINRTPEDLEVVNRFRKNFNLINESNLPALDKALTLLEDCRRYGTPVFSHLARSAFVSVALLKSAVEKI